MKRPRFDIYLGDTKFCLGFETKIMGVLNVTPDSFSDGGLFQNPAAAERRGLRMEEEGAHIIDVGGESTRPGARPVSAREEIRRVRPVLKRLSKKIKVPLSIDTYKYDVAAAALDEGAVLVNDVKALGGNRRLARLIARKDAGVVLMHMRGTPRTMQTNTSYSHLLKDIRAYLGRALDFALDAGIGRERVLVDPGFGFGKSTEQNFEILDHLNFFLSLRCPLLVGLSRKSFVGAALGASVAGRLYGSLGAAALAIARGAHILRVHEVLPHRHLAAVVDKTLNG